ncbi:MAG: nitroreductase family protein [Candidatus Izemoplasmatales bacterium]
MIKAIQKRTSIRSYEKKPLSDTDKAKVKKILDSIEKNQGPFNHQVKFFYVDNKIKSGGKIGTYGFVKNPPAFIGGVVENTSQGMIDFGFLFEQVILELTKADLGTVWLGGTFNRDDFDIESKDNEIIAAVSPVGYPANQSIREKIIRGFAKADKRKDFSDLFFKDSDFTPIEENHPYAQYLKAVQVGPSASNKQPWRILLMDDIFHLYLKRNKGYGNKLKLDIQAIDMGIALSHLYLSLKEDDYHPTFLENQPFELENHEYIMSIQIKVN